MKKVIAIRNKKTFLPMLIISAVSIAGAVILLCIPNFKWLGVITIVAMGLGLVESIIGLFVSPEDVIILEDNNITVYCGGLAIKKVTFPLSAIRSVYAEKVPKSQKDATIGIISLKIATEKGEKKISVPDVMDKDNVVSTLSSMITSSSALGE
ncbi:MAG: hypothetical protein E7617_06025 [Ruminococcaceae bacterium]|nr:hypothetical protein [Oscillospiraceae bacterium]